MGKKYRSAIEKHPDRNSIAGIPIETCHIASVPQAKTGTVYLTDKSSAQLKKHSATQETNRHPKKTVRLNGTPTIMVYRGYLNVPEDEIIDCYLVLNDIQHKRTRRVVAAYRKCTNRYFLSVKQLEMMHKEGFFPGIRIESSLLGTEPLYTGNFRMYSQLKVYGYRVGKNGLPRKIRQEILAFVLDKHIITRSKIISLLSGDIHLRTDRDDRDYTKAIADWEEDIKFVNDYSP